MALGFYSRSRRRAAHVVKGLIFFPVALVCDILIFLFPVGSYRGLHLWVLQKRKKGKGKAIPLRVSRDKFK